MRSHLSPYSVLSAAGLAPVSNSASEHPRVFTVNSHKLLAHASSICSADCGLVRPSPGEVSHYPRWAGGTRSALPWLPLTRTAERYPACSWCRNGRWMRRRGDGVARATCVCGRLALRGAMA